MSNENAICVGGPLDHKIVKASEAPVDYVLHYIEEANEEGLILNYYLHESMSIRVAFHTVFAAYGKKQK